MTGPYHTVAVIPSPAQILPVYRVTFEGMTLPVACKHSHLADSEAGGKGDVIVIDNAGNKATFDKEVLKRALRKAARKDEREEEDDAAWARALRRAVKAPGLEAAQAVMAEADAAQQRRTQLRRGELEERKKRKRERRRQREERKERKREGGRRNPIEFE